MKRLKKRIRSDTHVSEARNAPRRTWDRVVYVCLLILFFGSLTNYVAGDRLFLRADGLVLRDRTEIGAAGLVQITEVAVRPGQRVRAGDMLVRAESLETLGRLAELSMREAELAERSARLHRELTLAHALRPGADQRLKELQRQGDQMRALQNLGLVPATRRDAVRSDIHDAEIQAATLGAQIDGIAKEISALGERRSHARQALQQLQTRYRDGIHYAGIDGTVGDTVPATGEVLNPGEAILSLHWGSHYVLAYLPRHYLFPVSVGDEVLIRTGNLTRSGKIQSILPMSTAIPDEFHNAFRLRETRQLARISLLSGPELPTQAAVLITKDWRTDLTELTSDWYTLVKRRASEIATNLRDLADTPSEGIAALSNATGAAIAFQPHESRDTSKAATSSTLQSQEASPALSNFETVRAHTFVR